MSFAPRRLSCLQLRLVLRHPPFYIHTDPPRTVHTTKRFVCRGSLHPTPQFLEQPETVHGPQAQRSDKAKEVQSPEALTPEPEA